VVSKRTDARKSFLEDVTARFGLVPNFFVSAEDAPEMIERLWDFAKAAYLDNPMPSLFKERLFVYLSRFCEVRYCIARHCAFLLGYGHSSGDASVAVQTIVQVLRLLKMPPPWRQNMEDVYARLETLTTPNAWPEPETAAEALIFSAATVMFVEPARSQKARQVLREVLGGRKFEHLVGLLTFVRAAHYWTVIHPEIELEEDLVGLLEHNRQLHQALLEDPEAHKCDMGARLFSELETLRELNESRELKKANLELAQHAAERELLFKEANHRLKNSLQIVSSMLHVQLPLITDNVAKEALLNTEARVMAIAAVHERLYKDGEIGSVAFDVLLRDLCRDIANAYAGADAIIVDSQPGVVSTDVAIPVALIVNELVTNVFRHAAPPCHVRLHWGGEAGFRLTVSDAGKGPFNGATSRGFGTRMVSALVKQLNGSLETRSDGAGYHCELFVPNPSPGRL